MSTWTDGLAATAAVLSFTSCCFAAIVGVMLCFDLLISLVFQFGMTLDTASTVACLILLVIIPRWLVVFIGSLVDPSIWPTDRTWCAAKLAGRRTRSQQDSRLVLNLCRHFVSFAVWGVALVNTFGLADLPGAPVIFLALLAFLVGANVMAQPIETQRRRAFNLLFGREALQVTAMSMAVAGWTLVRVHPEIWLELVVTVSWATPLVWKHSLAWFVPPAMYALQWYSGEPVSLLALWTSNSCQLTKVSLTVGAAAAFSAFFEARYRGLKHATVTEKHVVAAFFRDIAGLAVAAALLYVAVDSEAGWAVLGTLGVIAMSHVLVYLKVRHAPVTLDPGKTMLTRPLRLYGALCAVIAISGCLGDIPMETYPAACPGTAPPPAAVTSAGCRIDVGSKLNIADLIAVTSVSYMHDDDKPDALKTFFPDLASEIIANDAPLHNRSYVTVDYTMVRFPTIKETVVTVRGSFTRIDWLQNLYIMSDSVVIKVGQFLLPIRIPTHAAMALVRLGGAFKFGMRRYPDRVERAIRKIQQERPEDKVVVTGHSLGGFTANVVAARAKVPSLAISPIGTGYTALQYDFERDDANNFVHSIIPEGDPVPWIDQQMGLQWTLSTTCTLSNAWCHSLENTQRLIRERCGDPLGRRTVSDRSLSSACS